MRCIKGALHAHAVIRAEGRTPGDDGRAVIIWNGPWKRDREEGKGWRQGKTNLDGV